jgi:hypothetical protein
MTKKEIGTYQESVSVGMIRSLAHKKRHLKLIRCLLKYVFVRLTKN